LKILHVYKDFDPPVRGGIERHIALMCRYQRQWADVSALTCSRSRRTQSVERDGTRVVEVGEWGRFQSAPISPAFSRHVGRSDADIIVVHVPNPTAEVSWLLTRPRGRLIVRYHSDVVRQAVAMRVYRPVLTRFLSHADRIIVASREYLDTSAMLRQFADRSRIIPYGVVLADWTRPDDSELASLRSKYAGRFVLFSGRHRYYKGLSYLVEAAREIEAPVVIAGDGPERASLERQARESGARVHFPGELEDHQLVAHLHACDVFAFPSVARSEAFGISILEAHACGTPVIATRLGTGVEFANLDGTTGLNVAPRDARALASAVNRLLRNDAERATMGRNARERVGREFQAEDIARREFEVYREAAL
jgi:rhamnosyl/mannosyltransferase